MGGHSKRAEVLYRLLRRLRQSSPRDRLLSPRCDDSVGPQRYLASGRNTLGLLGTRKLAVRLRWRRRGNSCDESSEESTIGP